MAQKATSPDALLQEQKKVELLFAGAIVTNPTVVMDDCGWLDESIIVDEQVKDLWTRVKTSDIDSPEGAIAIAIENGLFWRINENDITGATVMHNEWASQIAKFHYLHNAASAGAKVIDSALNKRDTDMVRQAVEDLSNLKVDSRGEQGATPSQIDEEFRTILDNPPKAVMTHIPALDKMLGGLYPGEMTVLAARPAMGKSSLAIQIGRTVAYSGKRALFISIEMTREQLWARMACGDSGIEWKLVRAGLVDKADIEVIKENSKRLADRLGNNLIIVDDAFDLASMHAAIINNKPDLVIIDQLADISWHDPKEKKIEWLGKACWHIRQTFAKRMRLPVLVVHQLNRGPESRGENDKRPTLADLRDSGEIEQRSDIVLGCYREDYYEGRPEGTIVVPFEVIPLKFRQGNSEARAILEYNLPAQWFS